MVYNDLNEALAEGKEGDRIFLEAGNYVSKTKDGNFHINKNFSITGANMATVIIQSNVVVNQSKIFQAGQCYFQNRILSSWGIWYH